MPTSAFPSYDALIERAYAGLPKRKVQSERFEVPTVEVELAGVKTFVKAFDAVCAKLRRQPVDVAKWLSRELAVPVSIEGARLVLNGKFATKTVNDKLAAFVNDAVLCKECGKPDTHFEGAERSFVTLVCEACGARRPVRR